MINSGKRSKTLSQVKPVKKKCMNLQSFLEISPIENEVLPSQEHVRYAGPSIWVTESIRIKRWYTLIEKLPESIKLPKFVSNRARISGEFNSRKYSHSTKFEWRPQILVKLVLENCVIQIYLDYLHLIT